MKKRTKKLTALAMAAVTAVSLAACGGSTSGEGGGASSGGDAGGKLTVAIWDNGQKAGLDQIVADFTAATGIEAEVQVITWDQRKERDHGLF